MERRSSIKFISESWYKTMHCLMSVNWISVNSLIIKINLCIWLDDNLFEQYKFNN